MDSPETHRVYLIPGLFGFATLAGYDYFIHLEQAISARFAAAGVPVVLERVPSLPTASISQRAVMVGRTVEQTAGTRGPIHLIGHSSGGLDARLLLSPRNKLPLSAEAEGCCARVRSCICVNTPHYGTPLAGYFTTVAGKQLLYVLSLLTITTLSVGHLPLSVLARLIEVVRGVDKDLGIDSRLVGGLTDYALRFVGEKGRSEIREFLGHIEQDRSGLIQLMPDVAELFNAAVSDCPHVRYGCVATSAPPPRPRQVLGAVLSPLSALHLAVYTTLYGVTSRADRRFGYAIPTSQQAGVLAEGLMREVTPEHVDGIVPTLSMLWGELLYCGAADHLDVVGHFGDDRRREGHVDWLRSGARFGRTEFASMVDAICEFLLR